MILTRREARWLILLGAVLAVLVVVFGAPGLYVYSLMAAPNGQVLIRVNRITGGVTAMANTFPQPAPPAQTPAIPPGVPPSAAPTKGVTK